MIYIIGDSTYKSIRLINFKEVHVVFDESAEDLLFEIDTNLLLEVSKSVISNKSGHSDTDCEDAQTDHREFELLFIGLSLVILFGLIGDCVKKDAQSQWKKTIQETREERNEDTENSPLPPF